MVEPHRLIADLVAAAGGTLRVAKAMRQQSFQPTLHKLVNGKVSSPKRETAQRIADFFGIPVDALYDSAVAQREWDARFGAKSRSRVDSLKLDVADTPPASQPAEEAMPVEDAIDVLATALQGMRREDREAVATVLAEWARAGGRGRLRSAVLSMLDSDPRKQHRTG